MCAAAAGAEEKSKKPEGLPLKPERRIEFTTDEGTWISLDVSPDGKTIVFELLGNLYTLPMGGGEATRITPGGLAFNSEPKYSPDGSRIAFVSDRSGSENLWTSNPDGTDPKSVTEGARERFSSPTWSSDGDFLLAVHAGKTAPPGVWMYHVKGGAGFQVAGAKKVPSATDTGPMDQVDGPVTSRDGRYLYYAKTVPAPLLIEFPSPFWQIARRDLSTGDEDVLTQSAGSALRPVLSPDGKLLVYGTRYHEKTGLRVLNLLTGEERWLKYPVQRDGQEGDSGRGLLPGYAFLPGGKEIVVAYGGKIHRVGIGMGEDRVIPFVAHVTQDLGPKLDFPIRVEDGPEVRARLIQQPVQSPDGRRLAFSALTRLYVMDLPAGKPRRVTQGNDREFYPAWSPDGESLAYVTWAGEGGHIQVVRSRGESKPRQLTRVAAYYTSPVWSPDGKRIVALRTSAEKARTTPPLTAFTNGVRPLDLVWMPSDGHGDLQVIAPSGDVDRPHFSVETDRIYAGTSDEIISLRFDGTDRRHHLKVKGERLPFEIYRPGMQLSPDGKRALVLFNHQLYLIAVPRTGGDAPTVEIGSTSSVPIRKLTEVGADYFGWADGGSTITWAVGSRFFRLKLSAISFESDKGKEGEKAARGTEEKSAGGELVKEKLPIEEISVAVERSRNRPKGSIVLRGARVITMKADEILSDADIVVTDNRITAVGPRGSLTVPQGARVLDLSGTTILPGLIDTHDHWTGVMRGVLDVQNWDFLANLAYGVTTGRDPQTTTNDMFAYQDLVEAGDMLGPRAFSTGPAIFYETNFQSAEEAYSVVSRYRDYYRTHTIKSYVVGDRRQRQWVIEACKKLQMMPTTEGAIDLSLDMTHAIDGFSGNEHALPVVPLFKDVVELFAKSGITETPTLLVTYGGPQAENYFFEHYPIHDDPKAKRFIPDFFLDERLRRGHWYLPEEYTYTQVAESASRIAGSGGRICIGGHGEMAGIDTHWEIWALSTGGMSNHEVLRSATLRGAEAIGYAQDLGSIEVGKLADLIVLTKNPLDDIHNTTSIRFVMKNGELFEGDTLNEVWPEQKPFAPLWFWKDKP